MLYQIFMYYWINELAILATKIYNKFCPVNILLLYYLCIIYLFFRLYDPGDVGTILLGLWYPNFRDWGDSAPNTCQRSRIQTTGIVLIIIRYSGILRDKTIADKLMNFPNNEQL